MNINVKIKLTRGMDAPEYATSGSAAVDLRAALEENEVITLQPGERKTVRFMLDEKDLSLPYAGWHYR